MAATRSQQNYGHYGQLSSTSLEREVPKKGEIRGKWPRSQEGILPASANLFVDECIFPDGGLPLCGNKGYVCGDIFWGLGVLMHYRRVFGWPSSPSENASPAAEEELELPSLAKSPPEPPRWEERDLV